MLTNNVSGSGTTSLIRLGVISQAVLNRLSAGYSLDALVQCL